MDRVVVTRQFPDEILSSITGCELWVHPEREQVMPREQLLQQVEQADGLLCTVSDRVDQELLDRAARLRVVSNVAVGLDNIDLEAAARRHVAVGHTPDVLTNATADLAWALILASTRRLFEAERVLRSGQWRGWSYEFMAGMELSGANIGILGLGRIGQAVARRAAPFGAVVLYHGPRPKPEADAAGWRYVDRETLFRDSRVLVICCALTPETARSVGARELGWLPPGAHLVNVARGPIVDEEALYGALSEGRLGGAALDVWQQEPVPMNHRLLSLGNVVAMPHIGSATVQTRRAMAQLAVANLLAGLAGRPLPAQAGRSGQ